MPMTRYAFALLLLPAALPAQAVLLGRVADGREGLPRVRVSIPALDRAAATDDSGRFVLRDLPAGEHVVVATRIGHAPARRLVRLTGRDTVRLELVLPRAAVALTGVQVTATPSGRDPLAVAQATSTVDEAALDRTRGATLGATLARQPGVHERWQGPAASAPIIRGLSGDRIVVLQDGQRSGDLAATASDHAVTIDPAAAERVEIVRGPAALMYGNNAIGGVVNVVSEDIPVVRPERATATLMANVESATPGGGTSVDVATPVGGRSALRARAGWREHDDLRVGGGALVRRLANTQSRARSGALGWATMGERGQAGLGWRGYEFAYGLPNAGTPADAIRLRGHRQELLGRAEWRARTDGERRPLVESAKLDANAQWYAHDELTADGRVGTALALRSQWVQGIARTRDLGPLQDGAIGAQGLFRQNNVSGAQALTPPSTSEGAGAFVFQELALGRPAWLAREPGDALARQVRIPVGVRWDRYVLTSEPTAKFGAGRRRVVEGFSGSAGVALPLAAGVSLGANLARAMRSPTAEELFSQAGHAGTGAFEIGDPALGAEVTTGSDVVLRVARSRASAQLAAYRANIDGFVGLYRALSPDGTPRDTTVANASGGQTTYPLYRVSQREARSRGVEASLEAAVLSNVVVHVLGDVVRLRDATGEPVPFTPAARMALGLRWDDGRRSSGVTVRRAFAQRDVPAGETPTDAYTLLDLTGSWSLGRGAHVLTVRVDNALDVLYRDAASRVKAFAPSPGRNVVVGVRTRW